jgi:hypothetical protein
MQAIQPAAMNGGDLIGHSELLGSWGRKDHKEQYAVRAYGPSVRNPFLTR